MFKRVQSWKAMCVCVYVQTHMQIWLSLYQARFSLAIKPPRNFV